jgi:hypothetical protein
MDDRVCEVLISQPERILGPNITPIGNISDQVCYGRVFFVKRTVGDTIYITVGTGQPSAQNYHYILTDDAPIVDDAVVVGDIKAVGSVATSILSTFARGGFWNKQK